MFLLDYNRTCTHHQVPLSLPPDSLNLKQYTQQPLCNAIVRVNVSASYLNHAYCYNESRVCTMKVLSIRTPKVLLQ